MSLYQTPSVAGLPGSGGPSVAQQQQLITKLSDIGGERFATLFYSIIDSRRSDAVRFFTPHSVATWEGNPAKGVDMITQLMTVLPPTKHSINTINTHPIQSPSQQQQSSSIAVKALLVSVSGTVQYGTDSYTHGFYHTFVVDKPDPNSPNHYISFATFRSRDITSASGENKQSGGRRGR